MFRNDSHKLAGYFSFFFDLKIGIFHSFWQGPYLADFSGIKKCLKIFGHLRDVPSTDFAKNGTFCPKKTLFFEKNRSFFDFVTS